MVSVYPTTPVKGPLTVPDSPQAWGLPHEEWWPGQQDAVQTLANSEAKTIILNAPTGSGKSLLGVSWAVSRGAARSMILCRSKLLQQQYLDTFKNYNDMTYLTGKNNWQCVHPQVPPNTNVNEAPCAAGFSCPLKVGGCPYYDHVYKATATNVVIGNYPVWLLGVNTESKLLSQFSGIDNLVCDEGHALVFGDEIDVLSSIELWPKSCTKYGLGTLHFFDDPSYYRAMAQTKLPALKLHLEACIGQWEDAIKGGYISKDKVLQLHDLKMLVFALERLANMQKPNEWIVDGPREKGKPVPNGTPVMKWRVKLCPILGGDRQKLVYKHAKRTLIMSATLLPTPETALFLGLEKGDYEILELPSTFPVENRPIFYWPVGKMTRESSEALVPKMAKRIDDIIEGQLPERGIIHTTSFMLVESIMAFSKYGHLMVTHDSKNRMQVIGDWMKGRGAPILISPSLHEGLDAKDDVARWQIITKVPYPNLGEPLWKARLKLDNGLYHYAAVSGVVQMAGRVVRTAEDYGVTFILDGKFGDLANEYPGFFPKWFADALVSLGS